MFIFHGVISTSPFWKYQLFTTITDQEWRSEKKINIMFLLCSLCGRWKIVFLESDCCFLEINSSIYLWKARNKPFNGHYVKAPDLVKTLSSNLVCSLLWNFIVRLTLLIGQMFLHLIIHISDWPSFKSVYGFHKYLVLSTYEGKLYSAMLMGQFWIKWLKFICRGLL